MSDKFSRRQIMTLFAGLGLAAVAPAAHAKTRVKPASDPALAPTVPGNLRLAVILPSRNGGFYKACLDGVQEAVATIGAVDILYAAPDKEDAKAQIALVNGFIKQKVDGIVILPVDGVALGPACRRAMARGIEVVSFDRPLPAGTRSAHLNATSTAGKASTFMDMLASDVKEGGDIAILAGETPGEDGKVLVSATMQEWLKPAYGKLKLAETSYGNGDEKTAYANTEKLLAAHPNLRGILAFDPDALVGAAQCIHDKDLAGRVFITGFGRPHALVTAMAQPAAVSGKNSAAVLECFAAVNPVDLGYGAAEIAIALARKQATADKGASIAAGRLGTITLADGNIATLAPFVIDEKNFGKFADMY